MAALPAAGNFAGGVLAEVITVSRRQLSLVLHLAAGIVFGVVAVELVSEAMAVDPVWLPIAAFVAGGAFYLLVNGFVGSLRAIAVGPSSSSASRSIFSVTAS